MERNRASVGTEGRMSVCYDSAPVPVRAKASGILLRRPSWNFDVKPVVEVA